MEAKKELKIFGIFTAIFLVGYFMPVGFPRFDGAILSSLFLVQDYAQKHVLTCLLPAFFIAGAISVFLNSNSVIKYFGPTANKFVAYTVASVSGTVLAVCSCTILPLFAGIYRMGAGIGPATAFLYSGPAINVLAIILTARILGFEIGMARAICAIIFAVVIGLAMHFIFRKEELAKAKLAMQMPEAEAGRPLWKTTLLFASMVGVLVFANWGKPEVNEGVWHLIYSSKWIITSAFAVLFGVFVTLFMTIKPWKIILVAALTTIPLLLKGSIPGLEALNVPVLAVSTAVLAFSVVLLTEKGEPNEWFGSTWIFVKQIMPLLFFGVLVAGVLLGFPQLNMEGIIPNSWVENMVGGNSVYSNFFASIAGAFIVLCHPYRSTNP